MRLSNALIEKRRPAFFAAGLLLAMSITLVSFEWRTPYKTPEPFVYTGDLGEEPIYIPQTLPEPEKKTNKPEPPKETEPKTTELNLSDEPVEEPADEPELAVYEDVEDIPTSEYGDEPEVVDPPLGPLDRADENPAYCGGETAMMQFLVNNLHYPEIPLDMGVQGTVFVRFVVGKNGKLRDAKIVRPVDPWLDAEALRVAKMLDCFTPGKQAGKKVDVYFVLPVRFVINR